MSKNVLLISVTTLKARSAVHLNVDDKLLIPEIKAAQDMFLVDALGSNLLAKLQTGVAGANLSTEETALLEDYVTDTLINYTLALLPMSSSFQFFSKGVIRQTDSNAELPGMGDMVDLADHYKNRAEFYEERLVKYLRCNSNDFPEYLECSGDISPASSGYSLPCYLDD